VVGGIPTVVCGEMEVIGLSLSGMGMELMMGTVKEVADAQAYSAQAYAARDTGHTLDGISRSACPGRTRG
jgi:hypothetical protein